MKTIRRLFWLLPVLSGGMLQADDLAPATLAKILKLVMTDAKEPGIACTDPQLRHELAKVGVALHPDSRIVWVKSPEEAASFATSSRITIGGRVALLQSGAIVALVSEGGRPAFYINKQGAMARRVALPHSILQLGKVAQ
jgi:hypothetical protein